MVANTVAVLTIAVTTAATMIAATTIAATMTAATMIAAMTTVVMTVPASMWRSMHAAASPPHSWAASAASLLTNAANSLAEAGRQATAERRAPSWQQAPPRRYEERYQRSAPAYQGVQDDGSSFQWLVLLGSLVAIPTVVASEISIASTGASAG